MMSSAQSCGLLTVTCVCYLDGYAPFLSMAGRETFLNVSDQVVAAPGPGHYDVAATGECVRVSATLSHLCSIHSQQVETNDCTTQLSNLTHQIG